MKNTITTKLGELCVERREGGEYPGFLVGLKRDGESMDFVWLEVDQSEEKPVLKIHAYNLYDEEPECDIEITEDEIIKAWEEK